MKLKKLLLPLLAILPLSACIAPSSNYYFDSSMLSPQIYNKFWAMEPQNDIANVFSISSNGSATLYRYSCDKFNSYKTKNKGTFGQIIENIAKEVENNNPGAGDLVREFVKIERYKLETVGRNELKLHSIVIGGWTKIKFTSVSAKHLTAEQEILGGLGGVKHLQYTKVNSPASPICKY